MNARLTIIGFENYLNELEEPKSLSDSWKLEDIENFDKDTLLASIMMKGGTFEPLYSDPFFYYKMVGMWWKKWTPTFQKWLEVLNAEYNPIWNKNSWEETHEDTVDEGTVDTATTDKEIIDRDTTGSKTSKETMDDDTTGSKSTRDVVDEDTSLHQTTSDDTQLSGKDKTTHDSDRDISVTRDVSAFDAPSNNPYTPHDREHTDDTLNYENTETTYGKKTEEDIQTDGTGTLDRTTTGTETTSGTDDRTTDYTEGTTGTEDVTTNKTGSVDTDTSNDRDFDRTSHIWGNIGITTSQKMIEEELRIRYWNFYEKAADIFVDEMCIRVY